MSKPSQAPAPEPMHPYVGSRLETLKTYNMMPGDEYLAEHMYRNDAFAPEALDALVDEIFGDATLLASQARSFLRETWTKTYFAAITGLAANVKDEDDATRVVEQASLIARATCVKMLHFAKAGHAFFALERKKQTEKTE